MLQSLPPWSTMASALNMVPGFGAMPFAGTELNGFSRFLGSSNAWNPIPTLPDFSGFNSSWNSPTPSLNAMMLPWGMGQSFGTTPFYGAFGAGISNFWGGQTWGMPFGNGFGFPNFNTGLAGFNPSSDFSTGGAGLGFGGIPTSSSPATQTPPTLLTKDQTVDDILAKPGIQPAKYHALDSSPDNDGLRQAVKAALSDLPKKTLDRLHEAGYKIFLVDTVEGEMGLAGQSNLGKNEIYISKYHLVPATDGGTEPQKVLNGLTGMDDLVRHEVGHSVHDLIYEQIEKAVKNQLAQSPANQQSNYRNQVQELEYANGIRLDKVLAFSRFIESQSQEQEQLPADAMEGLAPGIQNTLHHILEAPYELFAESCNVILDTGNQADPRIKQFLEAYFPKTLKSIKTLLVEQNILNPS